MIIEDLENEKGVFHNEVFQDCKKAVNNALFEIFHSTISKL